MTLINVSGDSDTLVGLLQDAWDTTIEVGKYYEVDSVAFALNRNGEPKTFRFGVSFDHERPADSGSAERARTLIEDAIINFTLDVAKSWK